MGAGESQQREIIDTKKNQIIHEIKESRYGDIAIYQNLENGSLLAVSKRVIHEEDEGHQIQNSIEILKSLQHESIVQLIDVFNNTHNEFCSSFNEIQQLYEYLDYDLAHDIGQRTQENIPYDESELWHIIASIIAALTFMQHKNYYHNDIRPSSILVNFEGKVKILPKPVFSQTLNSYSEILLNDQNAVQNNGIYLSPALVQNLAQKSISPIHNASKSDVFTLALSIIECALLKPITANLYDFNQGILNLDLLNDCLNQMAEKYSSQLVDFVHQMLNLDELQRPDVNVLFSQLHEQRVQVADRLYTLAMKGHVVDHILNPPEQEDSHYEDDHHSEKSDKVEPKQQIDLSQPPQKKKKEHSPGHAERKKQREEEKKRKKEEKKKRQNEKKKKEREEQALKCDDSDDLDAEFAKYLPPEKEKEFERKEKELEVEEIVKRHGKKHAPKDKKDIIFVEAKRSVVPPPRQEVVVTREPEMELKTSSYVPSPPKRFVQPSVTYVKKAESPVKWVEPSDELKKSKKLLVSQKSTAGIKFTEPSYVVESSPKKQDRDIHLLLSKYAQKSIASNIYLDTHETIKDDYIQKTDSRFDTVQKTEQRSDVNVKYTSKTSSNNDQIYSLLNKYGSKDKADSVKKSGKNVVYTQIVPMGSGYQQNELKTEGVKPILTKSTVVQDKHPEMNRNPFQDLQV